MIYDVIIIGNGPAGISASLYTKRANLNTLVIGKGEGELSKAKSIENYYGFENAVSGKELIDKGINQAKNIGVDIVTDEVTGIDYENEFTVKTIKNDFKSKTLILATGSKHNVPTIKGIKEYEGKGVSYCAICDGFFFKNRDVAVLGNGEYAISEALELEPIVSSITILTNGSPSKEVRSPKIKFNSKRIKEFRGNNDKIKNIQFEDESSLNISGVFIAEGAATSIDLANKIGIITDTNSIIVDEDMKTNVPGVFACGDCTGGLKQISKAVYEGTKSGLSAIEYLKKKR